MKVSCICKDPIVLSGVGPALAAGALTNFQHLKYEGEYAAACRSKGQGATCKQYQH